MRFHTTGGLVLFAAMLATPVLSAQDAEAVRQAVVAHYGAINAGDSRAVINQHAPNFSGFLSDGGPLQRFGSRDEQWKVWVEEAETEFEADVQPRDIEVVVFGDLALATFYLDGSWGPRGETRRGPWRVSELWIKEDGVWKEVHHHDSPLRGGSPPGGAM